MTTLDHVTFDDEACDMAAAVWSRLILCTTRGSVMDACYASVNRLRQKGDNRCRTEMSSLGTYQWRCSNVYRRILPPSGIRNETKTVL